MKHVDTLLQEGAIKLERETGRGVRDIDSTIFERPIHKGFNVDFDGDSPHYMAMDRQARLTMRQQLRRDFNNMSMAKKNKVRKIRRQAKGAVDLGAIAMVKNQLPLHHNSKLIFDSRLVK